MAKLEGAAVLNDKDRAQIAGNLLVFTVEDPRKAKGLVRREVTRIVTPGTVTDEALLEVYFIDVGQGDAAVLRTARGRWILFDAGPAFGRRDAGREQSAIPDRRPNDLRN